MERNEDTARQAPYCPPATLLMVLRTFRKRDVPAQIDKPMLVQLGVPEGGLVNRTWNALQYLGLIDADGETTPTFRALRYATDDQYPDALRKVIEKAYEGIFAIIDPATASEQQLNNAFHPYSPLGQRSRMVTLFLGLCQEAGVSLVVTPRARSTNTESAARKAASSGPRARPSASAPARRQPAQVGRRPSFVGGEDAALRAWFDTRPNVGKPWPQAARDRWSKTLMAIIDGLYEQDPWKTADDDEGEGGGE